ncbi:outer membrane beta-barrel protein [Salegentibacter sp. BLCTC]|uniref:outer membrane beta-barrel protein n=1 Tax=Salegentibacter sp. BLCTC TaxID=2697368 RepID=UPI00187B2246|nr:outer membrane beta-barrel protein [Salegentibacter sp. BLCTC]MBE7639142.1 outer membrane beta-barrel protein [Salegentibacter sp. BLCTC]
MIKKLLLIVAISTGMASYGQEVDFGVQAGYTNVEGKSSNSSENISSSGNSSGFYIGALADFTLSENFHLQPSVNYGSADELNFLVIPVLAQYHIDNSGFYFHAGPQATFILDDVSIAGVDILNTFGLDLAFGAGYEINSNFFVEAKYSLELTNRFSKDIRDAAGAQNTDIKSQFNALSIGLGYKF